MSATAVFDRTADRDDIAAKMDEYARQGGLVSKLDWAGNLVGLEAEKPSSRPAAKVLPMPKPAPKKAPVEGFIELDDRPVVPLTPVEVIPEPEVKLRAKVLPFPARKAKAPPVETLAQWCDRLCAKIAPAPTAQPPAPLASTPEKALPAPADITEALRTLRADAERALAHLNAVFPGCGK
jgi:hypothetical protein